MQKTPNSQSGWFSQLSSWYQAEHQMSYMDVHASIGDAQRATGVYLEPDRFTVMIRQLKMKAFAHYEHQLSLTIWDAQPLKEMNFNSPASLISIAKTRLLAHGSTSSYYYKFTWHDLKSLFGISTRWILLYFWFSLATMITSAWFELAMGLWHIEVTVWISLHGRIWIGIILLFLIVFLLFLLDTSEELNTKIHKTTIII